jgi:hypothetical protein
MHSCLASTVDCADRGHNVWIRAAAANVAGHSFSYFRFCEIESPGMIWFARNRARHAVASLLEHGDSRTDLPGSAEAALKTVVFQKCSLHRMQLAASSQALDCRDFGPVAGNRQKQGRR